MGSCWGLEKWKTSSLPTRNSQLIVFCKMIGIILLPYLWKMFIMYITFINPLVYPGGKKFPLSTNNVFWAAKKFQICTAIYWIGKIDHSIVSDLRISIILLRMLLNIINPLFFQLIPSIFWYICIKSTNYPHCRNRSDGILGSLWHVTVPTTTQHQQSLGISNFWISPHISQAFIKL